MGSKSRPCLPFSRGVEEPQFPKPHSLTHFDCADVIQSIGDQ